MDRNIKTVLIEPSQLLREGLRCLLSGTAFTLLADAGRLEELEQPIDADQVMVILAPTQQASHEKLAADIAAAKQMFASAWIVVLAAVNDPNLCLQAFRAGVDAFLTKEDSTETLVRSLELVTMGATTIPSSVLHEILKARIDDRERSRAIRSQPPALELPEMPREMTDESGPALSNREMCVLERIQLGDSNKLIARQYDLAEATVKVHVKAILRKIGATNRTQAAIWAMKQMQARSSNKLGADAI